MNIAYLKFFSNSRSRLSGFTLVELLVVFSIIATLSGVGIASFVTYSRTQQVTQTANNIKLMFYEARSNALSVVKTSNTEEGQLYTCEGDLGGFEVNVVNPTRVALFQVCSDDEPVRIRTVSIPNGFSLQDHPGECTIVYYNALSATANGLPCTLRIVGQGVESEVSVDPTGNVEVGEVSEERGQQE